MLSLSLSLSLSLFLSLSFSVCVCVCCLPVCTFILLHATSAVHIFCCVRVCARLNKIWMCHRAEESDTHMLGRTRCVGLGCVRSRILPMSPSLSISRSHYCMLVTLQPPTLSPIATGFIYRCNTDLCWRDWHSLRYCGAHSPSVVLRTFEGGIKPLLSS